MIFCMALQFLPAEFGLAEPRLEKHRDLPALADRDQFRSLAAVKLRTRQDLDAIKRMSAEKSREQIELSEKLRQDFSLQPEKKYALDLDALTVTEVTENGEAVAEARPQKIKPPEKEALVRLFTARRLTEVTLASLRLLQYEKEKELERVGTELKNRFGITNGQEYIFLPASNALFRVVAPEAPPDPAPDKKPASKPSDPATGDTSK